MSDSAVAAMARAVPAPGWCSLTTAQQRRCHPSRRLPEDCLHAVMTYCMIKTKSRSQRIRQMRVRGACTGNGLVLLAVHGEHAYPPRQPGRSTVARPGVARALSPLPTGRAR
jgi:hypothetical protein